jgi:endogenous inhibitor of DNA gyrase (YacG/DUF329 family)
MESDKSLPDDGALTVCTWCGAELGQNVMPAKSAKLFCSRRCEIDGNFWLFSEMCAIEVTLPPQSDESDRDGL